MVTPLCVSLLVNTAANGGVYFPPILISGYRDRDGNIDYQKGTEGTRVFSKQTAETLSVMMKRVFEDGTASGLSPNAGVYGGKTATAETGFKNSQGDFAKTAWFAGYYELGDERLSVAVLVEDGSSGTADAVRCSGIFATKQRPIREPKTSRPPIIDFLFSVTFKNDFACLKARKRRRIRQCGKKCFT